jgi:hypothetical protein
MLGNNVKLAGSEFEPDNMKKHFAKFGIFCWQSDECQIAKLTECGDVSMPC